MFVTLFVLIALTLTRIIILNQPKFGKRPSGERLERIKTSKNYSKGLN